MTSRLNIKLEDILKKTLEDFKPGAASEDIAKIRFDHYMAKRKSMHLWLLNVYRKATSGNLVDEPETATAQ